MFHADLASLILVFLWFLLFVYVYVCMYVGIYVCICLGITSAIIYELRILGMSAE
jgi:uncharacterized membrane protein YccC